MKIAVYIIGSEQISPDDWQRYVKSYIFDSSQSIDEIMKITGVKDISFLNLSIAKDCSVGGL